ncbi:hypothetical protein A2W24_06815 [Microgenomates group bacterium RBG_16_45_19]|nr:MAG: hypothetical protein A2W24_06815 [Microgenomates group bacterium RBG_16_45_19]
MDLSNWPILYKDILRVKDKTHPVGVCSLWTTRDVVQQILAEVPYNLIGNLYSAQGINAIIRNVLANPHLRVIVIWGSEMSLSGHSLLRLMDRGVDETRRIVGARGEIEREIPDQALKLFREEVKVVDMRGLDAKKLKVEVKNLGQKQYLPLAARSQTFPKAEPAIQVMPSEQTGFRVQAKTVAQTWLRLLNEIHKYGRPKHTRYSQNNELKEILNLTAVVTHEDPEKEYFPAYLPFSRGELKSYYAELLTAREIPGVAYNYGKLLRKDLGINQVTQVKKLLKKRPDSKKMAMTLLWPKRYWHDATSSDTPCLTQIFGSVQDKQFFLTAHFRSQDMVHGWPRNAFALRKFQAEIAQDGGYPLGPLTIITHSAHIYGDDFRLVDNLLMDWYEPELGFTPSVHFEFDQRGNVVVEVIKAKEALVWSAYAEATADKPLPYAVAQMLKHLPDKGKGTGRLIRATLYAPDGGVPLKVFEGRTAQEVAWQITDWGFVRLPAHAMYIGQELQKAEECIIRGLKYHQDPA